MQAASGQRRLTSTSRWGATSEAVWLLSHLGSNHVDSNHCGSRLSVTSRHEVPLPLPPPGGGRDLAVAFPYHLGHWLATPSTASRLAAAC